MLPLGLRVQEKLEGLIDKYMRSVGVLYRYLFPTFQNVRD